jgi:hypothetical protein
MLAYVFWHYPEAGVDASRYEARLAGFHRVLAGSPPPGFVRSATYRIRGAFWLPAHGGYEDWYELADWTALGALNAAAVSASMRAEHDAAAALAAGGAGGVYAAVRAAVRGPADDAAVWLSKPQGTSYSEFTRELNRLPPGCAVWQRQMVLGPTAEYCVAGPAPEIAGLRLPEGSRPQLIPRRRAF